jgi:hypothetical protein
MKTILSKGICAGIVALLIAMAAVPSIGMLSQPLSLDREADVSPEITASREETVTLTVTEYPPDGNPTMRDVSLTRSEAAALHQALDEAQGLAEQLAILQEYGVIPADASSEAMLAAVRQDMPAVEPADIWLPPLSIVFFSEVSASFRWGVSLRVGMTPFLDLLDRLLGIDWRRGIDLADLCFAMRGTIYTYGPLGTHRLYLEPGMIFMTGFVGYTIDTVLWRHSFYGAAVMTFAAGLGEHDFDPWFP